MSNHMFCTYVSISVEAPSRILERIARIEVFTFCNERREEDIKKQDRTTLPRRRARLKMIPDTEMYAAEIRNQTTQYL